jgi:hypothetical protein
MNYQPTREDFQPQLAGVELSHKRTHFRWDKADYNGHCVYAGTPCYFHWYAEVFDSPSPWIRVQWTDFETQRKNVEIGRSVPGCRVYAVRPIRDEIVSAINDWYRICDEIGKKYDRATREYDTDLAVALEAAGLDRFRPVPKRFMSEILETEPVGYFFEEERELKNDILFSGPESHYAAQPQDVRNIGDLAPVLTDDTK